MDKKYIIKNCYNCNHIYQYNEYGEVEKSYVCGAEIEWIECADCTDCLLKRVVEKCKRFQDDVSEVILDLFAIQEIKDE